MKLSYQHSGNEYSVETDDLGLKGVNLPEAAAYLLVYGFRQSCQDSIAGRALKVRNEMIETSAQQIAGTGVEVTDAHREQATKSLDENAVKAAVAQDLHGQLMKRRDAIQAGTIKAGGGGARDPFGTLCWNIAADMVVAAFKAKNGKGPKRDDAFESLVDQCLEKHRAAIEKEAKRRQDAVNKLPTIEI